MIHGCQVIWRRNKTTLAFKKKSHIFSITIEVIQCIRKDFSSHWCFYQAYMSAPSYVVKDIITLQYKEMKTVFGAFTNVL